MVAEYSQEVQLVEYAPVSGEVVRSSRTLRIIAQHPLTRLCFPTIAERWKYAEYHQIIQGKSETLLSLRETIERWRTTPYDVLFEEMKA